MEMNIASRTMEIVAPCSWGHAPEPHTSLKPALKALELLAPGNANARAEITALSGIWNYGRVLKVLPLQPEW